VRKAGGKGKSGVVVIALTPLGKTFTIVQADQAKFLNTFILLE
jgi:hypothetical protein